MSKYSDKVKRRLEQAEKEERTQAQPPKPPAPVQAPPPARVTPAEQSARDRAAYKAAHAEEDALAYETIAFALDKVAEAASGIPLRMGGACASLEAAYAVSRGLAKSELHSLFHMAECVKDEAVRVVERVELTRAIVARVYGKDEEK